MTAKKTDDGSDLAIDPAKFRTRSGGYDNGFAGEGLVAGDVVVCHHDTDGQWRKASARGEQRHRGASAFVEAAAQKGGAIKAFRWGDAEIAGVKPGVTYYLSPTPGKVCERDALQSGDAVVIIGIGKPGGILAVRFIHDKVDAE